MATPTDGQPGLLDRFRRQRQAAPVPGATVTTPTAPAVQQVAPQPPPGLIVAGQDFRPPTAPAQETLRELNAQEQKEDEELERQLQAEMDAAGDEAVEAEEVEVGYDAPPPQPQQPAYQPPRPTYQPPPAPRIAGPPMPSPTLIQPPPVVPAYQPQRPTNPQFEEREMQTGAKPVMKYQIRKKTRPDGAPISIEEVMGTEPPTKEYIEEVWKDTFGGGKYYVYIGGSKVADHEIAGSPRYPTNNSPANPTDPLIDLMKSQLQEEREARKALEAKFTELTSSKRNSPQGMVQQAAEEITALKNLTALLAPAGGDSLSSWAGAVSTPGAQRLLGAVAGLLDKAAEQADYEYRMKRRREQAMQQFEDRSAPPAQPAEFTVQPRPAPPPPPQEGAFTPTSEQFAAPGAGSADAGVGPGPIEMPPPKTLTPEQTKDGDIRWFLKYTRDTGKGVSLNLARRAVEIAYTKVDHRASPRRRREEIANQFNTMSVATSLIGQARQAIQGQVPPQQLARLVVESKPQMAKALLAITPDHVIEALRPWDDLPDVKPFVDFAKTNEARAVMEAFAAELKRLQEPAPTQAPSTDAYPFREGDEPSG